MIKNKSNAWRARIQNLDNPDTYNTRKHDWHKGKNVKKWLLMIFCYTYTLFPRPIFVREASPINWRKQIDRPTAKHQVVLRKSCAEGKEEIWKPERHRTPWKNMKSERAWGFMGTQRDWTTNQRVCMGVICALCPCVAVMWLCLLV